MSEPRWNIPDRIETERLVLRRYERADAEALAEVVTRNVPHLERYMEWIKFEPQSVEQRRAFIDEVNGKFDAGEDYTIGIFERATGEFIGGTGFHVKTDPDRLEIGYWIDAGHEGKGLVTEAAAALTRVALEFSGANLLGLEHAPSNERSAAVPRRLGFTQDVTEGRMCSDSGTEVESVSWRATRETLAEEPLASSPRPALFDREGQLLEWPA